MINQPPSDWKDLQRQVNEIFQRSGLNSEINKKITTVRGTVNIDVHAEDTNNQPKTTYLCECKYWQSNVPITVVHAFRTVIQDYGANWGFIISSKGFQSGAYKAAANSPVRLLTWWRLHHRLYLWHHRWSASLFAKISETSINALARAIISKPNL